MLLCEGVVALFDTRHGFGVDIGMTICTACQFLFFYPDQTIGTAIIAATDRMLSDTGLGIEYESSRWKALLLDSHHLVLVSGELTFNSIALAELNAWARDNPGRSTLEIATTYGQIVNRCSFQRAAKRYLAPLGVQEPAGLEGLLALGLPEGLVGQICDQLQSERVDCEAIIAGSDGRESHLYRVDRQGIVTQHDDIGFVSIGSGGIHASGFYMQAPYTHVLGYHRALLLAYFAKKRAEVAPGVGSETDLFLITGDGIFRLDDEILTGLQAAYDSAEAMARRFVPKLERIIARIGMPKSDTAANQAEQPAVEPEQPQLPAPQDSAC